MTLAEQMHTQHGTTEMKPLFIPLYTKYFDRFADGSQREELRLYGARWNESTCPVGRDVVLSKGYGRHARLVGRIVGFERRTGSQIDPYRHADLVTVYGRLDRLIAVIAIEVWRPKAWQGFDACPACPHKFDRHDMNCIECCPVKRGKVL